MTLTHAKWDFLVHRYLIEQHKNIPGKSKKKQLIAKYTTWGTCICSLIGKYLELFLYIS